MDDPGSPPLARERPSRFSTVIAGIGITPARAGKTSGVGGGTLAAGDHPRSRGKDDSTRSARPEKLGSPPLARERRLIRAKERRAWGITPARAGKTGDADECGYWEKDHPRSRGKDCPWS